MPIIHYHLPHRNTHTVRSPWRDLIRLYARHDTCMSTAITAGAATPVSPLFASADCLQSIGISKTGSKAACWRRAGACDWVSFDEGVAEGLNAQSSFLVGVAIGGALLFVGAASVLVQCVCVRERARQGTAYNNRLLAEQTHARAMMTPPSP